mmetsp:Transcript_107072/g.190242  ORF Transcript_107072/g.190242 Transcript_107072/m.190242 type:complete len:371 (-) Transcript_107072:34-1146(-)
MALAPRYSQSMVMPKAGMPMAGGMQPGLQPRTIAGVGTGTRPAPSAGISASSPGAVGAAGNQPGLQAKGPMASSYGKDGACCSPRQAVPSQQSTKAPGPQSLASANVTSAASDMNNSLGESSRQQAGFERRVAWLEEDVAVLTRRIKEETGGEAGAGAAGDPGLRALVARLDGELAAERRSRERLEARMKALEDSVQREHVEREAQLRAFSSELESTMRGLIGRIDDGLSSGAASMREKTDQTEVRLRTLIKRVDEGLSAGAAALQTTLGEEQRTPSQRPSGIYSRDEGRSPPTGNPSLPASRQRSPLNSQQPSRNRTPAATPSLAYPGTLQVPGSGLSSMNNSANSVPAGWGGGAIRSPGGVLPMGWQR